MLLPSYVVPFKLIWTSIGTKSMQNTSAYEEPRSSGKRLHEYAFDHRSIH